MGKSQNLNPKLFRFKVPSVRVEKGRYDFILQRCQGKRVLHLGCVDEGLIQRRLGLGTLLHSELEKVAKEVWGVDRSNEGIEVLRAHCKGKLFVGDVERLQEIKELEGEKFDVIVASELIEHVNNAGAFLQSARSLFAPHTVMILTTPNAFRLTEILHSLLGYEYVHPDHNYWFSWKTLSTLLEKHGYRLCESAVYSYGVFNWATFLRELQKLAAGIGGKNIKGDPEDESSAHILKTFAMLLMFPIRLVLYACNPFFADGLLFVVEKTEQSGITRYS